MYAELDMFMTSSQRLFEYSQLEIEDELEKALDKSLKEWPSSGRIEFENVTMKYREELDPSIRGLNVEIEAGMKVGIVGRTGAGKSSIL
jgi:ABC-type multidrug transport system fused ATPase/permease subunit